MPGPGRTCPPPPRGPPTVRHGRAPTAGRAASAKRGGGAGLPYVRTTAADLLGKWVTDAGAVTEEGARFTAQACRRVGSDLLPLLETLPQVAAVEVVRSISFAWAADLDPALQAWAVRVARSDLDEGERPQEEVLLLAAMGSSWRSLKRYEPHSPLLVANLLGIVQIPQQAVTQSLTSAISMASGWLQDIEEGKYAMGVSHSFVLARHIKHCRDRSVRDLGVQTLIQIAQQVSVPTTDRLGALTVMSDLDDEAIRTMPRPLIRRRSDGWSQALHMPRCHSPGLPSGRSKATGLWLRWIFLPEGGAATPW